MYASRVLSWRTVSKSNPFRHTVLEALEIFFVTTKFDSLLPTNFFCRGESSLTMFYAVSMPEYPSTIMQFNKIRKDVKTAKYKGGHVSGEPM